MNAAIENGLRDLSDRIPAVLIRRNGTTSGPQHARGDLTPADADRERRREAEYADLLQSLPGVLRSLHAAQPAESPQALFTGLDYYHDKLEQDGLHTAVGALVEAIFLDLPQQIPGGPGAPMGLFLELFDGMIRSDHHNEAAFRWLEAASKSNDWVESLLYCEVVRRGLCFYMSWELSHIGEMRKERAKRLYEILCNEALWREKRLLLTHFARLNVFPTAYSNTYCDAAVEDPGFEPAKNYIWRESEPQWDPSTRDATIKEMRDSMDELLRGCQNEGKCKGVAH
ncbi:MAG: hypothetical protein JWR69_2622 [Pedosphaera sp.]|nr:hypothetical protein [Pedosphaera sp.]